MRTRINSLWWELSHSLWLLWTITIYFNWVAFLYIGLRARRMKWIVWALVYAVPFAAALALAGTAHWDRWPGTLTACALVVMSLVSLVHALRSRRRYLLLLAVRQSLRKAERDTGTPPEPDGSPKKADELTMEAPPSTVHPSGEDSPQYGDSGVFRLKARASYLLATNIGGLILGSLLLLVLTIIRAMFAPGLYLLFVLILLLYLAGDLILWWRRGIRMIEIGAEGLTIRRGPGGQPTTVSFSRITGVDVFSKLGRKVVNILTGGTVTRLPGVTLFSGPRVRVTSDAFNEDEFEDFVQRIRVIAR